MSDDSSGRGSIGTEIFEEVEALVAAEQITRSEAFKRISERTGRREGTVAANYYRIARKTGAPLLPRGRRANAQKAAAPGRGRGRRAVSTAGGGDLSTALARVSTALEELQAAVRRQETELTRLRDENARFDEFRRLARKFS